MRRHRDGSLCNKPRGQCDQKHVKYILESTGTSDIPVTPTVELADTAVKIPLNQGGYAQIPADVVYDVPKSSVTITQPAEAQCSVEIKEDAKGNTQISVKIYNDDVYAASVQAYAIYKITRSALDSNAMPDNDVIRDLKKGRK